jgi:sporulation protein YlmC with PRC-barrel domain
MNNLASIDLATTHSLEIPLQAQVECTDGVGGRSVFVLINPVIDQVTAVVVRAAAAPNTEYIVPVENVIETVADTIRLRCSQAELAQLEPFIKTRFIEEQVPDRGFGDDRGMLGSFYYLPYGTPDRTVYKYEFVEDQQIPPGELAIHRGTRVEATDGYVGKVDEFVVDPANGHITHLVMREGHLWGQKDVSIPVSALGNTHDDTVLLKIDKHQIESLPTFPVHRRWS